MALLLAAAVLIAAGGTFYTYRGIRWNREALTLCGLRFVWMLGFMVLAINPTCTRIETHTEKPLLLVLEDQSGSFMPFKKPIPTALSDVFDTVHVAFGSQTETHLDSVIRQVPSKTQGRRVAAVWVQTDGVLTQGVSWNDALIALGNPVFYAAVPQDSVQRSGWELAEIQFPSEALIGQNCKGNAVFVHRGTTNVQTPFALTWGDEVIGRGVLPPIQGKNERNFNFDWTPEDAGIRQLKSSLGRIGKSVHVRREKPKLVVFGGPLHPDAAYFVGQLCAQRTVQVYYRSGLPESTDFDAAVWILAGGKPVPGEERFNGNSIHLPSLNAGFTPSESTPNWPGESYGIPNYKGWLQVQNPMPSMENRGKVRWFINHLGFAAAARQSDSIQSQIPAAWLDRLWTVTGKQMLRIQFPETMWSGSKATVEAVWSGWTAAHTSSYPQIYLELNGVDGQKSSFLPDGSALKTQIIPKEPGIYSYRAVGTFGGDKRVVSGQFEVLAPVLEKERASDYAMIRSLSSRLGGGWSWLDRTDDLVNQLKSDSRFDPVLMEQKKSRQWRDFWWAYLLFGLALGTESILRKRRFGRA